jgi:hypothetical protein
VNCRFQENNAFCIFSDIVVGVHYEFYDGVPLLSKWISISTNSASTTVRAGIASIESLNVNLQWGVYTYGLPEL